MREITTSDCWRQHVDTGTRHWFKAGERRSACGLVPPERTRNLASESEKLGGVFGVDFRYCLACSRRGYAGHGKAPVVGNRPRSVNP